MTVTLRPPANTFAAFAKGSNASANARGNASRDDDASSAAAAPVNAREEGRRAISSAVTYDRKTLLELRDANARVTSELPVELATSALEIVKNELNAAIAREQGSVWGKLQTKPKPMEESKGEKVGTTVEGSRTPVTVTTEETVKEASEKSASAVGVERGPLDADKSKRVIKSVLNKVSADKMDKMVAQLSECALSDARVGKALVSMLVDRACADERHASAYGELAAKLNAVVPTYAVEAEGEDDTASSAKTTTFKKMLLGALQDDFEASVVARQGLSAVADRFEHESQSARVKGRIIGVARMIGELFNRDVVSDAVARAVVEDLLGEPRTTPCEDDIEGACALLATSGARAEASAKKSIDAYIARLNVLAESEEVNPRVRFACRDVIELRGNDWVKRGGKVSAASASNKSSAAAVDLAAAPPLVSDEILFPEGPSGGKPSSSLMGPYEAPARAAVMPTAENRAALEASMRRDAKARAEAKADAAAAAASGEGDASTSKYSPEQLEKKIASFIDEYAVVGDVGEALLCVADLVSRAEDGEATKGEIAKSLVDHVVNASTSKSADLVGTLFAELFARGGFTTSVIEQAVGDVVAVLDDVAIDVPMAPKLLAVVVARIVAGGAVALDFTTAAGSGIEDVGYRRDFAGAALTELRRVDFAGLRPGALNLKEFARADDPDEDTVTEWLGKLNLSDLAT